MGSNEMAWRGIPHCSKNIFLIPMAIPKLDTFRKIYLGTHSSREDLLLYIESMFMPHGFLLASSSLSVTVCRRKLKAESSFATQKDGLLVRTCSRIPLHSDST